MQLRSHANKKPVWSNTPQVLDHTGLLFNGPPRAWPDCPSTSHPIVSWHSPNRRLMRIIRLAGEKAKGLWGGSFQRLAMFLPGESIAAREIARLQLRRNNAPRRHIGKRRQGLLGLPDEASSSRCFVVPTRCTEKTADILKSRLQGPGA